MGEQEDKRADASRRCKAAITKAKREKDNEAVRFLQNELKLIACGARG